MQLSYVVKKLDVDARYVLLCFPSQLICGSNVCTGESGRTDLPITVEWIKQEHHVKHISTFTLDMYRYLLQCVAHHHIFE